MIKYMSPALPWKQPFKERKSTMTKKMRAAIFELIVATKKFTPTDKHVKTFDSLARLDGKPIRYAKAPNLDTEWTDQDAIRLRNAVDEVKKLIGERH